MAAAGKSALVPFSGWLPRAMEGPTPSSAVFYGALSVHLGAFLLLRVSPLLDAVAGTVRGGRDAGSGDGDLFATLAARVQTDIKSALSFASLTQVGIIVAEIGLRAALPRADPHPRPRLPADAAVPARTDAAARLSHAGERDRRPPASPRATSARARVVRALRALVLSAVAWNAVTSMRLLTDYVVRPFVRRFAGATAWNAAGPTCWPVGARAQSRSGSTRRRSHWRNCDDRPACSLAGSLRS